MLAFVYIYIYHTWILRVLFPDIFQRNPHENMFPKVVSSHVSVCAIFGNVVSAAVSYCLSVGYIQHCRRPHWGEGDVHKTSSAHISTPKIPLRNQTGQRKIPIFMRNKMNFYLLVVKRCNGTSPIYNQMIFPLKHPFKGTSGTSQLAIFDDAGGYTWCFREILRGMVKWCTMGYPPAMWSSGKSILSLHGLIQMPYHITYITYILPEMNHHDLPWWF